MRLLSAFLWVSIAASAAGQSSAPVRPVEIKVVVVSMFEIGADTGDPPGEYQYWVERQHLDTVLPFPQGYHDLRLNRQTGVLGVLTGVGTARAASTIMALGLDPRFDLTHAYFLVAGIGGIDPNAGSLASAVWNDWVVDGDLGYEIDPREIPHDTPQERALWSTGYVPLRKSVPYEQPPDPDSRLVYRLHPGLVKWAYQLTREVHLPDSPELQKLGQEFDGAAAQHPPAVLMGANLSASTFWHGRLMQDWAERWVTYMTGGEGHYAISGMEDSGTMQSLTWLARAHRVDLDRVLVLRTASNFDVPKRGQSAAESLTGTKLAHYSAFQPSLDSAYLVGHVVVDDIVAHWSQRRDQLPTAPGTK